MRRTLAESRDVSGDRPMQVLLCSRFSDIAAGRSGLLPFREVEFSAYSQNGEDGILLYIFALIGTTNRRVVEVCAGDGIECNAANLIINHGWTGTLFDGDPEAIARGRKFYATRTNAWRLHRLPPTLVHAWIDKDNVNELIAQHGSAGEIDLLSLDMDGVDYWIWDAIHIVNPRVVVLEYNNRWGPKQAVTVPYADDFVTRGASVEDEGYFGASLLAFERLASKKNYRLIGANAPNTNAFFMRNDVGEAYFSVVPVETCLSSQYAAYQNKTKLPLIEHLPWVGVVERGGDVVSEKDN